MTIAPISAPTSGRVSRRDSRERRATRSSAAGWRGRGAGLVSTVVLIGASESGGRPGVVWGHDPRPEGYRVPPAANFPTVAMLDLSTMNGPVSVGLPPPMMLPLTLYSHSESTDR